MVSLGEIKSIIGEILQIGDRLDDMDSDTRLLGGVPEFDSMAVVSILTMIEENYGISIDDDEVSAEVFATPGDLQRFVQSKLA